MERNIRTLVIALVIAVACAGIAYAGSSPTVSTGSAASVTTTSATLQGVVNPQGSSTSYGFQYGLTAFFGLTTKTKSAGSGTKARAVSTSASGLIPGTLYHFRLFATNKFGTSFGADHEFRTGGHPPAAATTGPATAIGKSGATLTGTVNPNGEATSWTFQYGLTTGYGYQVFGGVLPASSAPTTVTWALQGIEPGVLFHYRLIALHGLSVISAGTDQTFFTFPNPTPVPRVKARTTPGTDKHRPYVFTTTASVSRPSSIPASVGCSGSATIEYFLGHKQVSFDLAPMQPNCTFSATTSFSHLPGSGKHRPHSETLTISIHFRGNGYLAPANARTEKVKLG
jgi:hypothetical protein